jgi:hypothetical protein
MPRKGVLIGLLLVVASIAATGIALAGHGAPPTYVQAPSPIPLSFTVSQESDGGQVYHDNGSAGTSGTACTASATDDTGVDNTGECWNNRTDLRSKDVTAAEGGAANCALVPGQSAGGVIFDGVYVASTATNCISPGTAGRVYTGALIPMTGSAGVAAGGNAATQGGCAQVFVEGDAPIGTAIAGVVNTVLSTVNPASHPPGSTDNDTDATICGDAV